MAGNYIGTNANGDQALSNGGYFSISDGVRLGTDGHDAVPEAGRNVISGNLGNGVVVSGQGCVVAGDYIGTDATGASLLSNGLALDGGDYAGIRVERQPAPDRDRRRRRGRRRRAERRRGAYPLHDGIYPAVRASG